MKKVKSEITAEASDKSKVSKWWIKGWWNTPKKLKKRKLKWKDDIIDKKATGKNIEYKHYKETLKELENENENKWENYMKSNEKRKGMNGIREVG